MSPDREVTRLAKQSTVYSIGTLIMKVGGLFITPLYLDTNRFSASAYGHLMLIEVTVNLMVILIGLGLPQATRRWGADEREDSLFEQSTLASILVTLLVGSAVAAVAYVFQRPLTTALLDASAPAAALAWGGLYAALRAVSMQLMVYVRVKERAAYTVGTQSLELLVQLSLIAYVLLQGDADLTTVVRIMALTSLISPLVYLIGPASRVFTRPAWTQISPMLVYGLPLLLSAAAGIILNVGDRYMVNLWYSAADVGTFGFASRISSTLNMLLIQGVTAAYGIVGLKSITAGRNDLQRRTIRHMAALYCWAALVISLASHDGLTVLIEYFRVDASYREAVPLVFWMCLGSVFFGLSQLVINSLVAAKKSRTISVIVVGSATLNLALNAVFIPWLGPIGAAYTTGISYAVFLLWSAIRVFQLEGISYRWERVIRTVLLVLLFYALAQALLSLATPLRIMLWICLILLYPISLRLAGVYAASDVQDLLRLVRNRLHRPRHHA